MSTLTASQKAALQAKLARMRAAALAEVQRATAESGNQHIREILSSEPGDAGDMSVADALADFNISMADKQIRDLREIEAALGRLRENSYGVCIECGEAIKPARLQAMPTAARCIDCQSKFEQTYAQPGTPTM